MTKSPTSKLLKLKPWLTLSQASKHLSDICGEIVSESDVLQFAAVGHLKLSVTFDTLVWAHSCDLVHYDETKLEEEVANKIYSETLIWQKGPSGMELVSLNLGKGEFLNIHNKYLPIKGLFDLPMFGCAWLKVEQEWRHLIGELKLERHKHFGTFLEGYGGIIYRLKDGINIRIIRKIILLNNMN